MMAIELLPLVLARKHGFLHYGLHVRGTGVTENNDLEVPDKAFVK